MLRGLYEAAVLNRKIHFSPFPPKQRGRRRTGAAAAVRREGVVVALADLELIMLRLRHAEMLLVLLTAFTGMRWSEAAAVRRSFLKLDPGDPAMRRLATGTYTLDPLKGAVHEDKYGHRFLGPPKSGPGRVFDLPSFLVTLLDAYIATLPDGQDILFPDRKGNYRRNADWNRCRWRPACDGKPATVFVSGRAREAVPAVHPGLWFHDLKHTHKAMMANGRVHEAMMDYRLGHVKPGAAAVYSHPTPEMRRELIDCLDRTWLAWNPNLLIDELNTWLHIEPRTQPTTATPKLLPAARNIPAADNALF